MAKNSTKIIVKNGIFVRLRGLKYTLDFCFGLVLSVTRSLIRENLFCKNNNLKVPSEIGENIM